MTPVSEEMGWGLSQFKKKSQKREWFLLLHYPTIVRVHSSSN
jgi:hypothetical protein